MGSGASKEADVPVKVNQHVHATQQKGLKNASELLGALSLAAFEQADSNNKGALDLKSFESIVSGDTLQLKLSNDEVKRLVKRTNKDDEGRILYKDLSPRLMDVLIDVYEQTDEDWNDWCQVKDVRDSKTYYLNKRVGILQKEKPPSFNPERIELRSFEYITLDNGTEVTSYVNDSGKRMYMDWDKQQWLPFPDEWYPQKQQDDKDILTASDVRVGQYNHPTRGTLTTYLFENSRNTRLYYDEMLGQWARMPLQWECNILEVRAMLKEINKALPHWQNVNEQLLALRECNYILADTIAFGEINFQANKRSSSKANESQSPSLANAERIAELERKLAEREKEIKRLKTLQTEEASHAKKELVREKTRVEGAVMRRERLAAEAEERIESLMNANTELREKIKDLESQLVAQSSDKDHIEQLEAQLAALTEPEKNAKSEAKKLSQALEQMRMENVALKLKLQEYKDKANKASGYVDVLKDFHRQVLNLKREQRETQEETQISIDAITPIMTDAVRNIRSVNEYITSQLEMITAKYLQEQMQRKVLYNKVQELRGNIRVFCRVRYDPRGDCVFKFASPTEMAVQNLQGSQTMVEFERCYDIKASQEQVFDDTKPIILSCIDGYNVCIMAYGQTGSGKTYTMMGPKDNPGVNRRAIKELFEQIHSRKETKFQLKASLMEIYNEKVFDLLTKQRNDLKVHVGPNGTYVGGLIEKDAATEEDILEAIDIGEEHRSVGATLMNTDSSRSHLILQIVVSGFNTISKATTIGKLMLVDLAGSERVSKTDASGERLVEAAAINKSLSALSHVFKALASNSPHVPYRNSKLTHVLQDSLGGDSKTAVFINVSPLKENLSETLMTIKFGQGVRKVQLGPAKQNRKAALPQLPSVNDL